MAGSFGKSILEWLKGQGGAPVRWEQMGVSGNINTTIPSGAATSFVPGNPHAGFIRIKQHGVLLTNANVAIGAITATDGTNTANVYNGDINPSGNSQYIDSSFFFNYQWQVKSFNITNIVTNNAAQTFDVEVVGLT